MDRAYAHALNRAAARQRRQSGRGGEGGGGGEAHRFNTDVNGNIISTDVSTSTQPILYPHERILVQELRRRVRKDCGHARLYMEPFMLVKFLRARHLNMDRAEKLLRDAVDWRKEHDTVRIIFYFIFSWLKPWFFTDIFLISIYLNLRMGSLRHGCHHQFPSTTCAHLLFDRSFYLGVIVFLSGCVTRVEG